MINIKVYRNTLGGLEANATVRFIKGFFDPSKFYFHAVSNAPDLSWPEDTDISTIVNDLIADNWTCTVTKDGFGKPFIDCIHKPTQDAINIQKSELDARFSSAERGYLRYGEPPADGLSINHRDGRSESGLSVFYGDFTSDGSYRPVLSTDALLVSYLTVMQRDAYRVYGDIVGTGADGEPLVKVTKIVDL